MTARGVGIHHVALTVADLERARLFYRDVLGLTEVDNPSRDATLCWFAAGSAQIHLILNPSARTFRNTTEIDSHDGHVAITIGSYDAMLERLQSQGVPNRPRPTSGVPWKRIFVTDPDGNVLELVGD
jgi:glyoxylase I family protein